MTDIREELKGVNWANINSSHFDLIEERVTGGEITLEDAEVIIETLLAVARQLQLDNAFYKGK